MHQNDPDLDDEQILVLDHVAELENGGGTATISTIRELLGLRAGGRVAQSLADSGYLDCSKHAVPRYSLTQNGKKAINRHRRHQSREDLVSWLYDFPQRPERREIPSQRATRTDCQGTRQQTKHEVLRDLA